MHVGGRGVDDKCGNNRRLMLRSSARGGRPRVVRSSLSGGQLLAVLIDVHNVARLDLITAQSQRT